MTICKDITGETYGNLTAVRPLYINSAHSWVWEFRCTCGHTVERTAHSVKCRFHRGSIPMCKHCLRHLQKINHTKHGLTSSPLFTIWNGMLGRCTNPNNPSWKNYGGRGIKVCDRWHDFKNFYDDMQEGYAPGLSIDRIDNDGNYEPNNCQWLPLGENSRKKRSSYSVDLHQLSQQLGIKYQILLDRVARGYHIDELGIPPRRRSRLVHTDGPTFPHQGDDPNKPVHRHRII